MEINKVYIMFQGDSSVGIPFEQFEMTVPCYKHDGVELEELTKQIKEIYEPFCETSISLTFEDEKTGVHYFEDGITIKDYSEY